MTAFQESAVASRPLAALGINDMEECAYRALLARHAATAGEIAKQLAVSERLATTLLNSIETKGLATHTPRRPRAYVAAPPEFVIETLVKQRQGMLERARDAIPELKDIAAHAHVERGHDRILELITNRSSLALVFSQLYNAGRKELMVFQSAPILLPNARQTEPVPRGVRVRTVSDTSYLETPGILEWIAHDMERGEEPRSYPSLPFKMMIVDHSIGLLTLVSDPEAPTLLVHRSALLEALCLLFELAWEKATPILSVKSGSLESAPGNERLTETADALVPMLAAGLNDKTIALELKISAATLNRRIGELMKACGARTRFQLGWHIALQAGRTLQAIDKTPNSQTLDRP